MASVYKRNGRWVARWKDQDGRWRSQTQGRDKAVALRVAQKYKDDARLRRAGIIDPTVERIVRAEAQPLDDHLRAYEVELESRQNTRHYIDNTCGYIHRTAEACGFDTIGDLDAPIVAAYMDELKRKGRSNRTINAYVSAIKSFSRWLYRNERLRRDVMVTLRLLNVKTDRRHPRRALTDEEATRLLTTQSIPLERRVIYAVAMGTGLRLGELRSLKVAAFHLDSDPPCVEVEAACSKHRRQDIQPIPVELAATLRTHLEGRALGEPALRFTYTPIREMKKDLQKAGIPYKNDAGEFVDFHALRHTYITNLRRAGVHLEVARVLARHSSAALTSAYTHTVLADLNDAVNRLPPPPRGIFAANNTPQQAQRRSTSHEPNTRRTA